MNINDTQEIWKDQKEFNLLFFPEARTMDERCAQTKEFILCSISEMDELLRAIKWKVHRKDKAKINEQQIKNELTDIFKYFISMCLVWGLTPEDVMTDYWRKSAVCRQRYFEEYISTIRKDDKVAVIDIDGVLADYKKGLLVWTKENMDVYVADETIANSEDWEYSANGLGISEELWQEVKHRFRTERGKINMPAYESASEFMCWLRNQQYKIIVLTSRPIGSYPNIYGETIEWLKLNRMPFDFLWWAHDKREKILESNLKDVITFAIDDDPKQVELYSRIGIKTYWMIRSDIQRLNANSCSLRKHIYVVKNLGEVLTHLLEIKGANYESDPHVSHK